MSLPVHKPQPKPSDRMVRTAKQRVGGQASPFGKAVSSQPDAGPSTPREKDIELPAGSSRQPRPGHSSQ